MIKVLNLGHVKLVDNMGSDLSIVRNARVSYNAEWRAGEDEGSDTRLIRYLYHNHHNTPFESVVFTFDVKAPIFVFRQWHRHRTQSYNELSARYRELPEEYYIPDAEHVGTQSLDSKQSRDIHDSLGHTQEKMINDSLDLLKDHWTRSFDLYNYLLAQGWPREIARTHLGVGTYSHMFTTVNLHNLFGFLRERLHQHAQYEIRVYAEAMLELIRPIAPVAVGAFESSLKGR